MTRRWEHSQIRSFQFHRCDVHLDMMDQGKSDKFTLAARELIDRHGDNAVEFAQERVAILKDSVGGADLDLALLVLSEVERLHAS